jgi:pilus assembly protein CpaB
VIERPVISPIQSDEPIVEARIGARGSGAGLGPMIPPGFRAMSVRVNDVVGVAGFVLPGMRVDVLVTANLPGRQDSVTATALQNVPVLSAGQTIQSDGKGQPISATVVTLLVNPAQAEALTLANSEGKIQLVLRNATDQEVARTTGRSLRDLYSSGLAESSPGPPPAPRPVEAVRRVAPPRTAVAALAPPPVQASLPSPAPEQVMIIRGNLKTVETAAPPDGK